MISKRNRTPLEYIGYGLYLYFSGLSLRRTSQRLSCFIKRNHVSVWNWIQKYKPQRISSRRRRISEYIVDETLIKVGSEYVWLWVAIESNNRQILALFYPYPRKETCLLQNIFSQTLLETMESIQSQQMVAHGTQWLVDFLD